MSAREELDGAIELYHRTAADFVRGEAESYKRCFSHTADISLANPFTPSATGWAEADETMTRAATLWRDGEVIGFERIAEYVTPELAYILEFERYRAKIGGADRSTPVNLRVTTILRPEDGTWRVIHRHADPITEGRPASSVIAND
jgi:ketosteroid isomerase-like protein